MVAVTDYNQYTKCANLATAGGTMDQSTPPSEVREWLIANGRAIQYKLVDGEPQAITPIEPDTRVYVLDFVGTTIRLVQSGVFNGWVTASERQPTFGASLPKERAAYRELAFFTWDGGNTGDPSRHRPDNIGLIAGVGSKLVVTSLTGIPWTEARPINQRRAHPLTS
jgi:hypothetical protein